MKFIVKPMKDPTKNERFCGSLFITQCWLCSEDPRACPPTY